MGCDFYIYIYLEIEHLHGTAYFELPVRRGYFSQMDGGYYDDDFEDEENENTLYNSLYSAWIDLELTPYPPKIIYEKDAFVSAHFEEKYKTLLETYFQENLWSNQKYDDDPNYDDSSEFKYKRHEDEGIPPESFDSVLKITRKENRDCPSRN